jgi:hypothetical protein
MKDLLDKLSSYNIFNYLFPGVLFVIFVDLMTSYHLVQKNIVIGVFLYYFLGSVVSRVGSLVVEPLFRKSNLLDFAPYDDFVAASKLDDKIELLSEVNNMYRTLCALMLSVAVVVLYAHAANYYDQLKTALPWVLIVSLFALYLLSYRKQTAYIVKRVKANLK